ncbi:MAG: hypothetical protein ACLQHL_10930 [Candidatus Cybelea sp.]
MRIEVCPMLSISQSSRAAAWVALLAAAALTAACGHSSQSVAPSALVANPASYDGQNLAVSGTAKHPHRMRRRAATVYQLCDSACINVIEFDNSNVSDESQVTVSGHFRSSFGPRAMNVLIVGERPGGFGGGAAPSTSP